jgi:hypothetical protein
LNNSLNIEFSKYDTGGTYYREGRKCIFDPIREILVIETPEEIIRQKFIKYLINELKVPKSKLEVEVPMAHFKKGEKDRADIIVYGENKEGCNIPIMIIECKAPNVPIVDETWFQAYKYDYILGAGLLLVTNGNNTYAAVWDEEDETYYLTEELPNYDNIVNKKNYIYQFDDSDCWTRPDFKKISDKETIKDFFEFGWLGEDTRKELYPIAINLAGFLHDTNTSFAPVKLYGLNIIEDGHRFSTFGNVAGGSWTGDYRYFILEDSECNNQIVSISIFGSMKFDSDPVFKNRRGKTVLVVAIDDFDKRHNSLQLNIDKYVEIQGNKFIIWHDGTLTLGKSGAAKRSEVVSFIREREPSIIDENGRIQLGWFNCNDEIRWSQENAKKFLANLIKYAILRDLFRKSKE